MNKSFLFRFRPANLLGKSQRYSENAAIRKFNFFQREVLSHSIAQTDVSNVSGSYRKVLAENVGQNDRVGKDCDSEIVDSRSVRKDIFATVAMGKSYKGFLKKIFVESARIAAGSIAMVVALHSTGSHTALAANNETISPKLAALELPAISPTTSVQPTPTVGNMTMPVGAALTPLPSTIGHIKAPLPSIKGERGSGAPLVYHGGAVQSDPQVYLIFWGSGWNGSSFPEYEEQLFKSLAGSSWNAILGQYNVNNDTKLAGSWVDQSESTGSVDTLGEVVKAVQTNGWSTGPNYQYLVFPQPGTSILGEGTSFCGWHAFGAEKSVNYVYSLIPFAEGNGCIGYSLTGDPAQATSSISSHEFAESATDPSYLGWYGSNGLVSEIGDLCAYAGEKGPGGTFVQSLWNNQAKECDYTDNGANPIQSVVGAVASPTGKGYWRVSSVGEVAATGDAVYYGSIQDSYHLAGNIVGIAATPSGKGYWLVGSDGGIFSFGDAGYFGSLPGSNNGTNNIIGMAATPDGKGYWLAGSDGGVYPFGDAGHFGSLPSSNIEVRNIVGVAATPDGKGYWLVGADGGVFTFGNAPFYGSVPGIKIAIKNIVGIASSPTGKGYWLSGSDGGVFTFGDVPFDGSMGGGAQSRSVVCLVPSAGGGYWEIAANGDVFNFGGVSPAVSQDLGL